MNYSVSYKKLKNYLCPVYLTRGKTNIVITKIKNTLKKLFIYTSKGKSFK